MPVPLAEVVKQLSDSGILAPGQLDNFVPPKAAPKDGEELLRELFKQNLLTRFQAQHVAAGRTKALLLGNYIILDRIGAGGMGQVFKAQHRRMKRVVALKMLPKSMLADPVAAARFQREVEAAAKLEHPNIVAAHDADEAGGVHFLVMQFVEGTDLSALVKQHGRRSAMRAVDYILQAARGLEYAHRHGIVHRDIKPANLLLSTEGTVKILDMGLARMESDNSGAQAELTGTGAVMGTVDYMSPEQAFNTKYADARADIYSLGCTLYFLLAGKPVYDGESVVEKVLAHRERPIPALSDVAPDASDALQYAFARMIAKRAEDRFQTMSEVIAALEQCRAGELSSHNIPRVPASESLVLAGGPVSYSDLVSGQAAMPDGLHAAVRGRKPRGKKSGMKGPGTYSLVVLVVGIIGLAGALWIRAHNLKIQLIDADQLAAQSRAPAKPSAPAEKAEKKPLARPKPAPAATAPHLSQAEDSIPIAEIPVVVPPPSPTPPADDKPPASNAPHQTVEAAPVPAAVEPSTTALPADSRRIDLLSSLDPARDRVEGEWQLVGRELVQQRLTGNARVHIPVDVQGEFDLELQFTRHEGNHFVGLMFPVGAHNCMLVIGEPKRSHLEYIRGNAGSEAIRYDMPIENQHRYTILVKVRHRGAVWQVVTLLDGVPFVRWEGDDAALSTWPMPSTREVGLVGHLCKVTFHSVQLTLRRGSAAEPSVGNGKPVGDERPSNSVFLSDLTPVSSQAYWPLTGKVSVNGVLSPHGLYMHPREETRRGFALYDIGGNFQLLAGRVSLNDSAQQAVGSITFSVLGDGRLLWKSAPLKSRQQEQRLAVDVRGVKRLELVTESAESNSWAHAVWIEPSLSGERSATAPASDGLAPAPSPPAPPSNPALAARGDWVDLLAWAEGVDWSQRGIDWNDGCEGPPSKDGITLKSLRVNRFPLPAIIDGNYEMEVEFTKHSGWGAALVFPVGIHNMWLAMKGISGGGGVNFIDGKWWGNNPTRQIPWPELRDGERHRVLVRVQHDDQNAAFHIDWDDRHDLISWQGPSSSLAFMENSDCKLSMVRRPWIGSKDARVTFLKARVRMTSGEIRRDSITAADRDQDLAQGFVRMIGLPASATSVGWGKFLVNQVPLEHEAAGDERSWPLIAPQFSLCPEYLGAPAPSRLKCPIPKAAKSFTAVGYNVRSRAVKYIVLVDGSEMFNSGMTGIAPVQLDLPKGAKLLELLVDTAGEQGLDRSYWCYPRFHPLAVEKLTDKMLDGKTNPLKVHVAGGTSGHGPITYNTPVEGAVIGPINPRDATPCDEFLFAHAQSSASYAVPKGMRRFTAIGYCVRSENVKFQVLAGGEMIFDSPPAGIVPIDVKLPAGITTLELRIDPAGSTDLDTSMWCYPRFHKG